MPRQSGSSNTMQPALRIDSTGFNFFSAGLRRFRDLLSRYIPISRIQREVRRSTKMAIGDREKFKRNNFNSPWPTQQDERRHHSHLALFPSNGTAPSCAKQKWANIKKTKGKSQTNTDVAGEKEGNQKMRKMGGEINKGKQGQKGRP